jgi:hypothetical protein
VIGVLLNEDAGYLFSDKTILLFEILDFNKKLLKASSPKLDNDNMYRIAWGYLRLSGLAKNYFGSSKIQLYKYKFNPNLQSVKYLKKNYPRIPFVYYDFIWRNKQQYEGYLGVQINATDRPREIRVSSNGENVFEVEEDVENIGMNITKYKQKQREYKISFPLKFLEYNKSMRMTLNTLRNKKSY